MNHSVDVREFSSIVQEFASYKLSIQGCSPKTVQEYLLDLRTFFRYLLARERDIDFASDAFYEIDVSSVGLERLGKLHTEDFYDFLFFLDMQCNFLQNVRHSDNDRNRYIQVFYG